MVIIVMMRKTSLADAKAHLSELVDQAEHHGKRIVILRHGKPAAAIVPVEVAMPRPSERPRLTAEEAERYLDELSRLGDPSFKAVDDLVSGRR